MFTSFADFILWQLHRLGLSYGSRFDAGHEFLVTLASGRRRFRYFVLKRLVHGAAELFRRQEAL